MTAQLPLEQRVEALEAALAEAQQALRALLEQAEWSVRGPEATHRELVARRRRRREGS